MTTTMKLSPVVLATVLLPLCATAQAQSSAAAAPTSTVVVQAGVAVSTRYSGSDERMVVPLLGVEYAHASGFFASTQRGLGYAGTVGGLSYSAALGYRGERKEKKTHGLSFSSGSRYLRGMGDVKGSATANLALSYAVMEQLEIQVATEQAISNRGNGSLYSIGAAATLLADGKNTVVLSASANAADKKYMQTYHGVTAAQSARSGYAVYTPTAGMHLAEAGVSWQYKLSTEWSVIGMVGAQTLLGDAKKSPLTRRTTSPVGAVFVSYSY
ncbi:MipA/OmpV family protein [Roseateles chitinivorans]|uniref:MipA/OmpV family protein n=1 Tax=Roseateles chitinivorans TaxID=2917965 RepID=UPI003D66FFB4